MRTLVYIGANIGARLVEIAHQYDRVFAFEPYPAMFGHLKNNTAHLPQVTLVNAACAESDGFHSFYVYPNMVSSSLGPVAPGVPADNLVETIEVPTINLYNYLYSQGVEEIDYYVSDCQGSDLTVLRTLEPMIYTRSIRRLMVETHNDALNLYVGLDNRFQGFKDLLQKDYKIESILLGRLDGLEVTEKEIPADEYEWDTIWSLK